MSFIFYDDYDKVTQVACSHVWNTKRCLFCGRSTMVNILGRTVYFPLIEFAPKVARRWFHVFARAVDAARRLIVIARSTPVRRALVMRSTLEAKRHKRRAFVQRLRGM